MNEWGGQQMICNYVLLRFQYSRRALKHGSIVVHWLTHVDVAFQASVNSRRSLSFQSSWFSYSFSQWWHSVRYSMYSILRMILVPSVLY